MDLVVGQHCNLASCNVRDLLPILCPHCQTYYCRDHIATDKHDCKEPLPKQNLDDPPSEWKKRAQCDFAGCNKPSLASAFDGSGSSATNLNDGICSRCNGSFCVSHRHTDAHLCTSSAVPEQPSKVAAAKALLAKNFPSAVKASPSPSTSRNSESTARVPTDPVKLARYRAVELMKMRHKAAPGDPKDKTLSIPVDKRLHVNVAKDGSDQSYTVWFRKEIIAGRALDLLATRFSFLKPPLKLFKITPEESVVLRLDTALGEQVEDGSSLLVGKM